MDQRKTVSELLEDTEGLAAALRRGVREALRRHKTLGNPVVFFEDGRPIIVPPEELVIPEEEDAGAPSRSPSDANSEP